MSTEESWKDGGEPYLPTLASAEIDNGIPTDLLARIAFQESSWRPEVIYGSVKSSAGCIGLMQLNPIYYPNAGKDWKDDVEEAALSLAEYHQRFQDWQLAVAAYNWGPTAVSLWLKGSTTHSIMPTETSNYVGHIVADVPVPGSIVPV